MARQRAAMAWGPAFGGNGSRFSHAFPNGRMRGNRGREIGTIFWFW